MPKPLLPENVGRGSEDVNILKESGSDKLNPGGALAKAFLKAGMGAGVKRKEEVKRPTGPTPKSDMAEEMREKEIMQGKPEDVKGLKL